MIGEHDLPRYFNGKPQNVGVVLGPTSSGLTDVDLDCREAIATRAARIAKDRRNLWPAFRPGIALALLHQARLHVRGRKATIQFKDPTRPADEAMLLEVRVGGEKGAQTVFPGSVHETDEEIRWDESGTRPEVDRRRPAEARPPAGLDLPVRALLARADGARHDAALSLGGFLARAGLKHAADQVPGRGHRAHGQATRSIRTGRTRRRTRHRHFTPASLRADIRCSAKPSARRSPSRSRNGWTIAVQPATTAQAAPATRSPWPTTSSPSRAPPSSLPTSTATSFATAGPPGSGFSGTASSGSGMSAASPTIGPASFRAAWAKIKTPQPARTWAGRRSRTVSRSSHNTIRDWS